MSNITIQELAKMIDCAAVSPITTELDVRELVALAKKYKFISIGTFSCFMPLLKELLGDQKEILIGCGVGFPSGYTRTYIKIIEARDALADGCREIDMVANIGYLKSGRFDDTLDDIKAVVDVLDGIPLKVIIEVAYLTNDEIKRACDIVVKSGAAFIKTGTGWTSYPITLDRVHLIKSQVGDAIGIKASGGIKDLHTLLALKDAGASRFGIGKNSAIKIMEECEMLQGK